MQNQNYYQKSDYVTTFSISGGLWTHCAIFIVISPVQAEIKKIVSGLFTSSRLLGQVDLHGGHSDVESAFCNDHLSNFNRPTSETTRPYFNTA